MYFALFNVVDFRIQYNMAMYIIVLLQVRDMVNLSFHNTCFAYVEQRVTLYCCLLCISGFSHQKGHFEVSSKVTCYCT